MYPPIAPLRPPPPPNTTADCQVPNMSFCGYIYDSLYRRIPIESGGIEGSTMYILIFSKSLVALLT